MKTYYGRFALDLCARPKPSRIRIGVYSGVFQVFLRCFAKRWGSLKVQKGMLDVLKVALVVPLLAEGNDNFHDKSHSY
jgi:hypothetical protein